MAVGLLGPIGFYAFREFCWLRYGTWPGLPISLLWDALALPRPRADWFVVGALSNWLLDQPLVDLWFLAIGLPGLRMIHRIARTRSMAKADASEGEGQQEMHPSPAPALLSLAEIETSIRQIFAKLDITPDRQDLPNFSKGPSDGSHVGVDDRYHIFSRERGIENGRLSTQDLAELQYWIVRMTLSYMGIRIRGEFAVPGIDDRRVWDLRQVAMMRRINPAWAAKLSDEVREMIAQYPYHDNFSPAERFTAVSFSEEYRFQLGIDLTTGQYYLGIPVSNGLVDDEDYYTIDARSMKLFRAAPERALPFLEQARAHALDHQLIFPPGSDRNVPT